MGAITLQRAEVFDEEATGDVVGAEFAAGLEFFEPDRAQFRGGVWIDLTWRGIFLGDGFREDVAEDRLDGFDAAGGDVYLWSFEGFFCPEEWADADTVRGAGGDGEGLVVDNISIGEGRIREAGDPCDGCLTGGIGEDFFRVWTVVERFEDAFVESRDGSIGSGAVVRAHGSATGVEDGFSRPEWFRAPVGFRITDDFGLAEGIVDYGRREDDVTEVVAWDTGSEGGSEAGALETHGSVAGGRGRRDPA